MTTPTTNLSINNIAAEFGATSNPLHFSVYYQGGAYVPSNQATSATDGTPIPTSGQIRFGEFRGITKAAAGNANGGSVTASWINAGTRAIRSPQFTLQTDGTVSYSQGVTTNTQNTSQSWYTPHTAGIGSGYTATATVVTPASATVGSGTFSGTYGSAQPMTSNVSWSMANTSTQGEATGAIRVDIKSGSTVVASWNVSFDAGYAA